MPSFTSHQIERARTLIAHADREFGDYSRTDLLLDNMASLRNTADAHGLLAVIGAERRPPAKGQPDAQ